MKHVFQVVRIIEHGAEAYSEFVYSNHRTREAAIKAINKIPSDHLDNPVSIREIWTNDRFKYKT